MLPPNDYCPTDPPPISEIPPDARPNPPSISQIPSQNHDRTPTPTPTPAHPRAYTHARPIAHTPVRTRPRATGKIASHERKGASKASETGRITPPSAHRQAKPAQLTSREQKGRPPNIKTARNIQNRTPIRPQPRQTVKPQVMSKRGIKSVRNRPNNTPIRSQPMLQHDSGHMRTATTPLRNIRHAHARKHKYTH